MSGFVLTSGRGPGGGVVRRARGSCPATYRGRLELVDRLPDEVRYLGVKAVHKRHLVWLPYIGNVETKSKLKNWEVDPPSGGMGTRVRWSIDDVKLKKKHWITVDIEFEPPPFEVPMTSQVERVSSTTAR